MQQESSGQVDHLTYKNQALIYSGLYTVYQQDATRIMAMIKALLKGN